MPPERVPAQDSPDPTYRPRRPTRQVSARTVVSHAEPSEVSVRARHHTPIGGLAIGLIAAGVYVAASQALPHAVGVALAIAAAAGAAGAWHESALARFVSRVAGGGATPAPTDLAPPVEAERPVGPIGAVLLLIVKLEALAALDPSWIAIASIVTHPLSRALGTLALGTTAHSALPASTGDGRDAILTRTRPIHLLRSTVLGLLPFGLAAWWFDALGALGFALAPAVFGAAVVRRIAQARLGGMDRDGASAVQQVAETATYLGLVTWLALSEASQELSVE
jgi:cobalamin synthase